MKLTENQIARAARLYFTSIIANPLSPAVYDDVRCAAARVEAEKLIRDELTRQDLLDAICTVVEQDDIAAQEAREMASDEQIVADEVKSILSADKFGFATSNYLECKFFIGDNGNVYLVG